jgi:hypothetical protein
MYVLYWSRSYANTQLSERLVEQRFRAGRLRTPGEVWNLRGGGAGRVPAKGQHYYVYLLTCK